MTARPRSRPAPIAIVGIGCRLPGGADDLDTAIALFRGGNSVIGPVPPERWRVDEVGGPAVGGFVGDVDRFDAGLFGIAPREARAMDPQQRLLLEAAWAALEDGGVAPDGLRGSLTGVYVGLGLVDWARRTFASPDPRRRDAWSGTGAFDSVAAGRIAYALGLRGPAMAVHTACSSSLVAIHLAAKALRDGECDLALAGGVSLMLAPEPSAYFAEIGAVSPTGACRTFDADADGYVRGEGVGLAVLQRLDDALAAGNPVKAVLLGSAVNHDGRTHALTAPSGAAQRDVMRAALRDAGIAPADVGYVEAHGTGTPLGDPIEVEALAEVYGSGPEPLHVSSGKPQIGHLEAAAGIAGVIRAIGALREGVPPMPHLRAVNPRLPLADTRLRLSAGPAPWAAERRIAAVSAFGLSGTNAHAILAAFAPDPPAEPVEHALIAVSGATTEAATARWAAVGAALDAGGGLGAVARAASDGRAQLRYRVAAVVREGEPLGDMPAPREARREPGVVFAFTGQGAQHAGMGRRLYEVSAVYRDAVDAVDAAYRRHTGRPLLPVIHGDPPGRWIHGDPPGRWIHGDPPGRWIHGDGALDHTRYTQPALFAVEYGLARMLAAYGVVPAAVIGHSVGELVAAAVAGVGDLDTMVALVAARAEALAELPAGGAMAAVHASEAAVAELLAEVGGGVALAAVNAPDEVVVSGPADAVSEVVAAIERRGGRATPLTVSHAFHSPLIAPAGPGFEAAAAKLTLGPAKLPLYSAVDGRLVEGPLDAAFWRAHLVAPVRFADAVAGAVADGSDLFVEIGPRPVLSGLGPRIAPGTTWIATCQRGRDEHASVLAAVGGLFVRGARPAFRQVHAGVGRASLPPYPFARDRYWLEAAPAHSRGVDRYRVADVGLDWPEAPAPAGTWWSPDPRLADALRAAGVAVLDEPEPGVDAVFAAATPAELARIGPIAGDPRIRRVWLVAYPDAADAAWGLAAAAAVELGERWGGLVAVNGANNAELVRALAATDGEDVALVGTTRRGRRLEPVLAAPPDPPRLPSARAVLVTGGLGAFGLAIARLCVDLGARELVLVSRRGVAEDAAGLDALRERARVDVRAVDLAGEDAAKALVAGLDIGAVVHAAGVAAPGPVDALDSDALSAAWAPKVTALERLDEALADKPDVAFVLVSSIAGIWGSPSLAAYAVANRAMTAVARRRRARGAHAAVVAFGPVDVRGGMVSAAERAGFARAGVPPIPVDDALRVIGSALRPDAELELVAANVAWDVLGPLSVLRRRRPLLSRVAPAAHDARPSPKATVRPAVQAELSELPPSLRRRAIADRVADAVARVLGHGSDHPPIERGAGLFDLGLDSAMAVALAAELRAAFGVDAPATLAFDRPSVDALAAWLDESGRTVAAPAHEGAPASSDDDGRVAIVGLGCRLPGASDPETLWTLVANGGDALGEVPAGRWVDPAAITQEASRRGGFLPDEQITSFEPSFFGIADREAAVLDPQQRLLLEVGWEALERAGIAADRLAATRTGVYVGVGRSEYWDRLRDPDADAVEASYPWVGTGNASSFVAGRVAHTLGLRGPAVAVDTACSSSLVAVHLAVRALRGGEVDLALAGGVNVLLSAESTLYLGRIGALSDSGRCRPFDAAADGYVRAEGCGVLVLKRLADARRDNDKVIAVIRGSAVGHDGASGGLTVPNGPAQAEVIARACADAGVDPAQLAVLEAHGTGTPLGDPIELAAAADALGAGRGFPLVVTALKSNVGHLETAAGVAGIVKLALALERGAVPPIAGLTRPNPALRPGIPVRLATRTEAWPAESRLGGVSSFGISGTTAHVVLEGVDPDDDDAADGSDSGPANAELLLVSAHTPAALSELRSAIAAALGEVAPADAASTLAHGRASRQHRFAVVGVGAESLRAGLTGAAPSGVATSGLRVGFVVGQGPLSVASVRSAYDGLPGFRRAVDAVADGPPEHDTPVTRAALAVALGGWLSRSGVGPVGVVDSNGAGLAGAAIAGVLSPTDAVALARVHGDPARAAGLAATLPHAEPACAWFVGPDGQLARDVGPGWWTASPPTDIDAAIRALAGICDVVVALGDVPGLTGLLPAGFPVVATFGSDDGRADLLRTLGDLWVRGASLVPDAVAPRTPPAPLPTTPWQRTRWWVDQRREPVPAYTVRWEEAPPAPAAPGVHVVGEGAEGIADHPDSDTVAWVAGRGTVADVVRRALRHVRSVLDDANRGASGAAPRIVLVTRGGVAVDGDPPPDPAHAAVWGLAATLGVEHPDHHPVIIDLGPTDGDASLREGLAAGVPRVAVRAGRPWIPSLARVEPAPGPTPTPGAEIRADRSYLVTGGAGALGVHVARWLLQRGAGDVVVAGRTPKDVPGGARFVRANVERRADVDALVAAATERHPLGGVFHLAGAAGSALLRKVDDARLGEALGAKVDGALHLSDAAGDVPLFVVFSSAIAWLGRVGAGAYGAGNAAAEAIVSGRVAAGRSGHAIAWGPWSVGMAGDAGGFAADGVTPFGPAEGLAALERALVGPSHTLVIDAEHLSARKSPTPASIAGDLGHALREGPLAASGTAERVARIAAEARAIVAKVLGRPFPAATGWFDAGLDSVMAVDVARRLARALDRPLPSTLLFDHPDVERLARHLDALAHAAPTAPRPPPAIRGPTTGTPDRVAIVGMACRFPGASTPEALWELLLAGKVAVRGVPADRWRIDDWWGPAGTPGKMYAREGGFVDGIDLFDPEPFGISPREAASIDPQHRLLLEVGWEALERAGLLGADLRGSATGVYVGIADRGYLHRFTRPGAPLYPDAWAGTGSEPSFAPGRVAHALGLEGPVVALNTTCSSSLVAVHLAANALLRRECDQALAGGVSLMLLPDDTAYLCALGALSPTDRCTPFDARADGYVRSEGCGLVVLKRLSDVRPDERVWAVIEGSATNHDGASSGLTVPNGAAQRAVLRAALDAAGANPADVAYLEAHGTGTALGDPIEVRAAMAVYGERGDQPPLHLGAVKANLGHLELAAGAASLIKAALALHHRAIPPHPTYAEPNPGIDLRGATIPTRCVAWPQGPRLAAVSGFGLSGTNAHIVLGPGRPAATPEPSAVDRPVHVLALSAASDGSLRKLADGLLGRSGTASLARAVHRRRPLRVRAAIVAADEAECDRGLQRFTAVAPDGPPRIAMLFGGQGLQYARMGLALAEHAPPFAAHLARCAEVLDPLFRAHGASFSGVLVDDDALGRTEFTQPAIAAVELALAAWLRDLGVVPEVVAGHSLGELVAATVAGVWTTEDALRLLVTRGRLMADLARPGGMAAIQLGVDDVAALIASVGAADVEIAAENAPDETSIAGPMDQVDAVLAALRVGADGGPDGTGARKLAASRPFHSACVDPMLDAWAEAIAATPSRAPAIPVASLLTGALETESLRDPLFWRRHARERVRVVPAMASIAQAGCTVLVDASPHPGLLGLARRSGALAGARFVPTLRRDADPWRAVCEAVGALFESGLDVDWAAWDAPFARRPVEVPTYPFDRRRFWLAEPGRTAAWTYAVRAEPDRAAPRAPPAAVRIAGHPALAEALASALGSRGIPLAPDGDERDDVVTIDLRPLQRGDAPLATWLSDLTMPERGAWLVVTRGAEFDPDQAAVGALVRCVGLEHPDRPARWLDTTGQDWAEAAVDALTSAEPELRSAHGVRTAPRLHPIALAGPGRVWGTWIVTGGTGAVGVALARWLGAHGAERIVLAARSPVSESDPRWAGIASVRATGADVTVAVADAADPVAIAALVAAHPPDGVVHAAGITEPQASDALSVEVVRRTLAGKADGAAVLDAAVRDRELQAFVVVSSIAAVWGSRDLAAYAAANAYAEAVVRRRRARGAAGRSVALAFGPWGGGQGMVDGMRAGTLARSGLALLEPALAAEAFGQALGRITDAADDTEPDVIVVVNADWARLVPALEVAGPRPLFDVVRAAPAPGPGAPADAAGTAVTTGASDQGWQARLLALPPDRREAAVIGHLDVRVREVLRLDPGRPLSHAEPLTDHGFDSLMATELKATLLADGLDVPLGRLLGGPSLEELATMVVSRLPDAGPAATVAIAPGTGAGERDTTLVWTHLAAMLVGIGVASAAWWLLR